MMDVKVFLNLVRNIAIHGINADDGQLEALAEDLFYVEVLCHLANLEDDEVIRTAYTHTLTRSD